MMHQEKSLVKRSGHLIPGLTKYVKKRLGEVARK